MESLQRCIAYVHYTCNDANVNLSGSVSSDSVPIRPRLRDVAAVAGVSVRTVSNVVRRAVPVSPETRARVESAIEALGYVPNLTARSLRSGRSNLLGMLVPEFDVPYFAELARTISDAAAQRGFGLLVQQADGQESTEREFLERFTALGLFDGLIVNPLSASAEVIRSAARRMPLVVIGEHAVADDVVQVAIDNRRAAKDAVEHLLAIGRTKLAVVGIQSGVGTDTARCRVDGVREALKAAGLCVHPEFMIETLRFHREHGADAAKKLLSLRERPDCVFCLNDQLAIGLMHEFQLAGVRIPQDISVVGFDNSLEGRFASPALTTIAPDTGMIAERTLDALSTQMRGKPTVGARYVRHTLLIRDSSVLRHEVAAH